MLIPHDRPVYRILAEAGFFGPDDHLYREGDVIAFDDEPNEEMEPMNELARDRMQAFFQKLDDGARKMAEKAGREYSGRPRTADQKFAVAREDERRVQLISGGPGVPLMGGKTGGKSRVARVEDTPQVPQTGAVPRGSLSLGSR